MAENEIHQLSRLINDAVGQIVASNPFREWVEADPPRKGDLVVLNNSFLYRDGITTSSKSPKYLCLLTDSNGEPKPPATVISSISRVNARFKRIPARHSSMLAPIALEDAIRDEISQLGTIVFALAARIGRDQPVSVAVSGVSEVSTLRYEPDQTTIASFRESTLSLNALDDIDALWRATVDTLAGSGIEADSELASQFEEALADLREAAGRPINPSDVGTGTPSILDDVGRRIGQQVDAYRQALATYSHEPHDAEALNELLRISYNFADGAKALVTLVVGISDLKPVVFWLTISDQSDLADRFSDLPFALVGKAKPSLDRYRTVISGARNRAFHDLFAFGRPFRVQLTGDAFRAPELRLFREFRRRSPALEFDDRELVDLLEGFTRASESPVPVGFWEKNLAVMESVASLARSVLRALVLLAGAKSTDL